MSKLLTRRTLVFTPLCNEQKRVSVHEDYKYGEPPAFDS